MHVARVLPSPSREREHESGGCAGIDCDGGFGQNAFSLREKVAEGRMRRRKAGIRREMNRAPTDPPAVGCAATFSQRDKDLLPAVPPNSSAASECLLAVGG